MRDCGSVFVVFLGGFLTMMCLHAASARSCLAQFVGNTTVDSAGASTAHYAVNRRSVLVYV